MKKIHRPNINVPFKVTAKYDIYYTYTYSKKMDLPLYQISTEIRKVCE